MYYTRAEVKIQSCSDGCWDVQVNPESVFDVSQFYLVQSIFHIVVNSNFLLSSKVVKLVLITPCDLGFYSGKNCNALLIS